MLKRKIKNTDQNLPPISLVGNSTGNVLNVKKDKDKEKKSTRRTESILARMPKMQGTAPTGGGGTRFGGLNAGGLMARLKKFSPKELGLLATGIMLLVMLPLGAHMMSADSGDNGTAGKPGFYASKAGGELFEPGLNGFAPGGTGIGGETITPLSVRDPLSLIVGPDAKDPEVETPAPAAPPIEPRDFRDTVTAVAPVAARAVSEVVSAPNIPRLNGGIRGLGAVSAGGTGGITGQLNSGKITSTANNAPSKISSSDMVSPIAMKGFAGASSRSNKSSSDAFDALKAKANNAADMMNEGSSLSGADAAAKASNFGTGAAGASGALGYVGGGAGKAGSASGAGDKSTVSKSKSAASKLADKRAEKDLELEYKAKEAALQNKLDMQKFFQVEMPKKLLTSMMDPIGERLGKAVKNAINPKPAKAKTMQCRRNGQVYLAEYKDGKASQMSDDAGDAYDAFKAACKNQGGQLFELGDNSSSEGAKPTAEDVASSQNSNQQDSRTLPQQKEACVNSTEQSEKANCGIFGTSVSGALTRVSSSVKNSVTAAVESDKDSANVLLTNWSKGIEGASKQIESISKRVEPALAKNTDLANKWNKYKGFCGKTENAENAACALYGQFKGEIEKMDDKGNVIGAIKNYNNEIVLAEQKVTSVLGLEKETKTQVESLLSEIRKSKTALDGKLTEAENAASPIASNPSKIVAKDKGDDAIKLLTADANMRGSNSVPGMINTVFGIKDMDDKAAIGTSLPAQSGVALQLKKDNISVLYAQSLAKLGSADLDYFTSNQIAPYQALVDAQEAGNNYLTATFGREAAKTSDGKKMTLGEFIDKMVQ